MASENSTAPGVPGVPAGSAPSPTVASQPAPVASGGLAGDKKPLFGGKVGSKLRQDGLKPGSPEAIAADRVRDAARKRAERAAKRAETPPPPLPSASGNIPPSPSVPDASPGGPVADLETGFVPDAQDQWRAEDFNECAPELIELVEGWRVDSRTKQAVERGLPRKVVEQISKDVAWPANAKRSLSRTSPATLADIFNALKVPVRLKKYVTTAPLLLYIAVRDLAAGARIEKLASEEDARKKDASASASPTTAN